MQYSSVSSVISDLKYENLNNDEISNQFQQSVLQYYLGEGLYKSLADRLLFLPTAGVKTNSIVTSVLLATSGYYSRVYIPYPFNLRFEQTLRLNRIKSSDYRYVNYRTGSLNFAGMLEDFYLCPNESCFIINVPGCYPTGLCLQEAEWNEIWKCCVDNHHFVWFNVSHLGLRSGNGFVDFSPIRECIKLNIDCIVSLDLESSLMLPGLGTSAVVVVSGEKNESDFLAPMKDLFEGASLYGMRLCSSFFGDENKVEQWFVCVVKWTVGKKNVRIK